MSPATRRRAPGRRTPGTIRDALPPALATLWLVPLLLAALVVATGSPGAAVIGLVLVWLLASLPLTWFLCRHRMILTDRAIVMGPFVPGVAPDVLFYADIDTSTIRTWSNLRLSPRLRDERVHQRR